MEDTRSRGHPQLAVRPFRGIRHEAGARVLREGHDIGEGLAVKVAERRGVEHPDPAELRWRKSLGSRKRCVVGERPLANRTIRVDPQQPAREEHPGAAVGPDRESRCARKRGPLPGRRDHAGRLESGWLPGKGVRGRRRRRGRGRLGGRRWQDGELVDAAEELGTDEGSRHGGREEQADEGHDPDQAQRRSLARGRQQQRPPGPPHPGGLGRGPDDRLGKAGRDRVVGATNEHGLEHRVGQDVLAVHRSSTSSARSSA